MATAQAIADRATAMATSFLEASREDIEQMVDDDAKVLFEAAQIVRRQADGGSRSAYSVEHLAFSLITAAHEHLRTSARPPGKDVRLNRA